MKKAYIEQILIGAVIFMVLIVLGATLSDDTEARNKYYKLKRLTDNAALSAAKYYTNVENDVDASELIANNMLDHTDLGKEIKNSLVYTWDFISNPNTVTVSLPSYTQDTFWYKFIDLDSLQLKASSQAQIIPAGDILHTSDLTPFGVNGCDESHLSEGSELTFDLRGHTGYSDEDYSEFYGIDLGDACSPDGNSNWAHFKNEIKNFYVEDGFLKNDDALLDVDSETPFCVPTVSKLSMEQNNDPKQISQSFGNLENNYDLVGVQLDIVVFDCGSAADDLTFKKFIKVEFLTNPSSTYDKVKNDYDIFQFDLKIIQTTQDGEVKLVK